MSKVHKPRFGSLQFWPRKRARKLLPSLNWKSLESKDTGTTKNKILGFIGYKVGMMSAIVKDNTPNSMTKGKQIVLPVTIIECPPMKIFAVRLYKNGISAKDIIAGDAEKEEELKGKLFLPKKTGAKIEEFENKINEYDDVRIIAYSLVKQTGIKKTPDIIEVGLKGTPKEKLDIAKSMLSKEIKIEDLFSKGQLIDIKGVTKGKGFVGPVKRFGISLKQHKSEKGVRRPGTLGPWIPKRVSFRAPLAGQLGVFTRIFYNSNIVSIDDIKTKNINPSSGFANYGNIKTSYVIVKGSVPGTQKRAIMLSAPLRTTKKTAKQSFDLVKLE